MRLTPLNIPKIYSNNYSIQTQEKAVNTNNSSHIPFKPSKFDCSRTYFLGGVQVNNDGFISDDKHSYEVKKITTLINNPKNKRIAIIPHNHPDLDALGSATALKEYLSTQKNKSVDIISPSAIDSNLDWLDPDYEILRVEDGEPTPSLNDYDLIICLDFSTIHRAGRLKYELKKMEVPSINIDHHEDIEEKFCDTSLKVPKSQATSVLVYELIKRLGGIITPEIATPLLAGIYADTKNLNNIKLQDSYVKISRMVREMADVSGLSREEIWDKSLIDYSRGDIKELVSDVNNNILIDGKVKAVVITQHFIKSHPIFETDFELAYNVVKKTAHKSSEIPITCFILEDNNGSSNVSLRSNGSINLLNSFDSYRPRGGENAASFYTKDDIEDVFENICTDINSKFNDSNFDSDDVQSEIDELVYPY